LHKNAFITIYSSGAVVNTQRFDIHKISNTYKNKVPLLEFKLTFF